MDKGPALMMMMMMMMMVMIRMKMTFFTRGKVDFGGVPGTPLVAPDGQGGTHRNSTTGFVPPQT